MTIEAIIGGISAAIDAEFNAEGDRYAIRANELKQGLKEPCFFVSCIGASSSAVVAGRFLRESAFCVQYFPADENGAREECGAVADRLFPALRYVTVDGVPKMGTEMRAEFADGMLHFFVNYDAFVRVVREEPPAMEDMTHETAAKEREKADGKGKSDSE